MTPLNTIIEEEKPARRARLIQGITLSEYSKVHHWLRTNYGKATMCEEKSCSGKSSKYEWAKLPNVKYEQKRENFIQLCKSCHVKMDFTEDGKRAISEKLSGRKLPKDVTKDCLRCKKTISNVFRLRMYCDECVFITDSAHKARWNEKNIDESRRMKRDYARKARAKQRELTLLSKIRS